MISFVLQSIIDLCHRYAERSMAPSTEVIETSSQVQIRSVWQRLGSAFFQISVRSFDTLQKRHIQTLERNTQLFLAIPPPELYQLLMTGSPALWKLLVEWMSCGFVVVNGDRALIGTQSLMLLSLCIKGLSDSSSSRKRDSKLNSVVGFLNSVLSHASGTRICAVVADELLDICLPSLNPKMKILVCFIKSEILSH